MVVVAIIGIGAFVRLASGPRPAPGRT